MEEGGGKRKVRERKRGEKGEARRHRSRPRRAVLPVWPCGSQHVCAHHAPPGGKEGRGEGEKEEGKGRGGREEEKRRGGEGRGREQEREGREGRREGEKGREREGGEKRERRGEEGAEKGGG